MTCPMCIRPILSIWHRLILWAIAGVLSLVTASMVWWARGQWDGQVVIAERARAAMFEKVADGVVERDVKKQLVERRQRDAQRAEEGRK